MTSNNSSCETLTSFVKEGNYKKVYDFLKEYDLVVDDTWTDYKILIDAVQIGNAKIVQLLLNHGCRVFKPRDKELFPLHLAVMRNNPIIVKILLEHGVNPNTKCQTLTPLHLTIKNPTPEIIKLLLAYKANILARNLTNKTPIHETYYSCMPLRTKNLDILLSAHGGTMANAIDDGCLSIFHIACTRKLPNIVENFLQNGVDVNMQITQDGHKWGGFASLHFAALYHQFDVIKVLLKYKANVNLPNEQGFSALWIAVKYLFTDEIAHKLNKNFVKNRTSHKEIRAQQKNIMKYLSNEMRVEETIQLLLENQADVNLKDNEGCPLLFEACFIRMITFFSDEIPNKIVIENLCKKYAYKCHMKNVKMLIDHGIDVNAVDNENNTILNVANDHEESYSEWREIIQLILKNGADPNLKNNMMKTPLHTAAEKGFYEYVSLLLQYKADPNITDEDLCTPLHYAKSSKIFKALVDAGADVNAKDKNGKTPKWICSSSKETLTISVVTISLGN